MTKPAKKKITPPAVADYSGLVGGISELLEASRQASARAVNALMTATYWEIGRRIVAFEQGGAIRAEYGTRLIERLSLDLTQRLGRGFGQRNLECMRQLFLAVPVPSTRRKSNDLVIPQTASAESGLAPAIPQTLSAESPGAENLPLIATESLGEKSRPTSTGVSALRLQKVQTPSAPSPALPFDLTDLARAFPLPWSHYVLLVQRSRSPEAFAFYHTEALRGGWSVRQLQRQRVTALSSPARSERSLARVRKSSHALVCALDRYHSPLASIAGVRASRRPLAARASAGRVVDGLRKGAGG